MVRARSRPSAVCPMRRPANGGCKSEIKNRPTLRVRIVAIRKSAAAAETARRKARKAARDHGHTVA